MKTEKRQRLARDRRRRAIVAVLVTGMVVGLLVLATSIGGWELPSSLPRNAFANVFGEPDYRERAEHPIVSLPDVVVGLNGAPDLYVDAAFDLEVASEADREAVRLQLSRMREETISFLSALGPDELRGSDELTRTKARLLDRFRSALPNQHLKALYVTYLTVAKP